jgi:hypothetical protein
MRNVYRLIAVVFLIVLVSFAGVSMVRADTPDPMCTEKANAIIRAIESKKPRTEIDNLLDTWFSCRTTQLTSNDLPTETIVQQLAFPNWVAVPTFATNSTQAGISHAQTAIAGSKGRIALALKIGNTWKAMTVFSTGFEQPKPLYAFHKDGIVFIAVYFEDSQSQLAIYHLDAETGTEFNGNKRTLTFETASAVIVTPGGCFAGTQQGKPITFCPLINKENFTIDYPIAQ